MGSYTKGSRASTSNGLVTRDTNGHAMAAAWAENAEALADWALSKLIVRRDVHGAYSKTGTYTSRDLLNRDRVIRHFRGEVTIGAHSISTEGKCLSVVWDIDAHEGQSFDADRNFKAALRAAEVVAEFDLVALISDSNGNGGYHVRVVFKLPIPSKVAWWLGNRIKATLEGEGLACREAFPKQPEFTLEHPFGNWIRMPGRHPKRDHWTRIYDPDRKRWLEGESAVRRLLRTGGDDPKKLLAAHKEETSAEETEAAEGQPKDARKRQQGKSKGRPDHVTEAELKSALDALPKSMADEYDGGTSNDAWLGVGMALHSWDTVRGLDLWKDFSSQSLKYDSAVCDAKWATFNQNGGLTVRLIFARAIEAGWRPPREKKADPSDDETEAPPKFTAPPEPLVAELRPVPAFDPELLPDPFRTWALDIADRAQCSIEFVAVGIVIVLAAVVGRKVGIRPKRQDYWLVVPNLWGLIVGRPGVLKSHALEEAMGPLKALANTAERRQAEDIEEFQRRKLIADAKREAARDGLKKAAKKGGADDELMRLAGEATSADGIQAPKGRRYLVNDTTVEKLGELLNENPNGLLLFRDELNGFLRSFEKQNHETDRAFYLEAWNGTGSYTYDRIGRGTIPIKAVCLSILGGIQPGPLASYLRAATAAAADDGLVPRFQVAVYPDQDRPFRIVDRVPNLLARERAVKTFEGLDEIDAARAGATPDEKIPYLRFDDEAQDFFYRWFESLETTKLRANEPAVIESHLSKYRSLMPSLALLFHLVDLVYEGRDGGPVSLVAARRAADWCDFLEQHARRIYQHADDGDIQPASTLAERLKESLPMPFAARDVQRKCWKGLTTQEDVELALAVLEDHGWIASVEVPAGNKGGRPTLKYWVNPAVATADPEA